MIQIRYFASLRERLGTGSEAMDPPAGETTVADIVAALRRRGSPWSEVLGEGETVKMAVNQEMACADTPVRDGDELAFFPPVTGG
jgi:molybdopterin synthase sulfur carrier subunit